MNCKSKGVHPSRDCSIFRKQALIFHPDKNLDCKEEAQEKFKLLQNYCPFGKTTRTAEQVFTQNPIMKKLKDKSSIKKDEILQTIINNCGVDSKLITKDKQVNNVLNIFKNMYMRYYYIKDNINDEEVNSNINDSFSISRNFKVFLEKTLPRKMERIKNVDQLCIYETLLGVMKTLVSDLNYILENSLIGGKKKKKMSKKKMSKKKKKMSKKKKTKKKKK